MEVRGLRPLPLPPPQLQGKSRSEPSARLSQSCKVKQKKEIRQRQRQPKDDGNALLSTISHGSPQNALSSSAWWFNYEYEYDGILIDRGNEEE